MKSLTWLCRFDSLVASKDGCCDGLFLVADTMRTRMNGGTGTLSCGRLCERRNVDETGCLRE